MKNPTMTPSWFVCVWFVCFPAGARAEIVTAESIEWVLANSDRVVVGKVVKVDTVVGRDKETFVAATVAISKTLKGAHTESATFLLHNDNGRYAKQWLDEGIPILFCLVKHNGVRVPVSADTLPWMLREDGKTYNAVLLGKSKHVWTGCMLMLTRNFDVLTETEPILKRIELEVKATEKDARPRSHTISIPSNTAVYKKLWSYSDVRLIVPIDQKLETLGRNWCESKSAHDRREGAKILRHFKNDINVKILKSLLEDPNTSESTMSRKLSGKVLVYRMKTYYIRQAAFDALRDFEVNVEKPVLERELLEWRDDPPPSNK